MTHGTAADFARRHVEEIINGRRPDLIDELYAPDAVYNDPVAPGGTARGRREIKAFFSAIFQAMPDVRFSIDDNFGTRDRGLCRGTISATLRGDFGPLPATGKAATAPIAEIVRIADGQIAGLPSALAVRCKVVTTVGDISPLPLRCCSSYGSRLRHDACPRATARPSPCAKR